MPQNIASKSLANRPSLVEWVSKNGTKMRFLISDCPRKQNLHLYLREFLKFNVRYCVRVCEKTYSAEDVEEFGIKVVEMKFDDGGVPPIDLVCRWLDLVDSIFYPGNELEKSTIAVHCVAGLGRAPLLVALALIENGMSPSQAIDYIRDRRKGAFNRKQLVCLEQYRRVRMTKKSATSCSIM